MANKDFKVKNGLDISTPLPVSMGGTGQTSTTNTLNSLLPNQAGNTNKVLQTDGSNTTWVTVTQQTATDSVPGNKTYVGTNAPGSPATGDVWIDSSAGNLPTLQRWAKTAAGGETSLSGIDDNNITLTYVVGTEQVYQNGILLVRNADYTATNGTSISFTSALVAGDSVNVLSFLGGSVADTYTQAQANSTFYPTATTQIAGKNLIINGGFDIWQRGTSFGNEVWTADRWFYARDGGPTATVTRQTFTPGNQISGQEPTYFWRYDCTSVGTPGTYNVLQTRVEDVRTLAGQTATISFWAKADSSRSIRVDRQQNFGTGGSSQTSSSIATFNINSSWQRYSATFTAPSVLGTTIGPNSYLQISFVLPVSVIQTIDIWGVQLESGSVATAFSRAGGSVGAELSLCQRYYFRATSSNNYGAYGFGTARATSQGRIMINLPVQMRVVPTSIEYSGLALNDGLNIISVTTCALTGYESYNTVNIDANVSGTPLTQYRPYWIHNNNNNANYLAFSAEL